MSNLIQVGSVRVEIQDAPELKFPGDQNGGTDREAGALCRLFVHGMSRHILRLSFV